MINIHYKIEFFDAWHTGSGLAAGADVDALVIKDKNNLPYIPGKTIKGLVREALEEILKFKSIDKTSIIKENFGIFIEEKKEKTDSEGNTKEMIRGNIFFTNAHLSKELSDAIAKDKNLYRFMYRSVSSTAIDENSGVAKKHSLRRVETTIPCELYGEILNIHKDLAEDVVDALSFIKRLGVSRNRGLGRCQITVVGKEDSK